MKYSADLWIGVMKGIDETVRAMAGKSTAQALKQAHPRYKQLLTRN